MVRKGRPAKTKYVEPESEDDYDEPPARQKTSKSGNIIWKEDSDEEYTDAGEIENGDNDSDYGSSKKKKKVTPKKKTPVKKGKKGRGRPSGSAKKSPAKKTPAKKSPAKKAPAKAGKKRPRGAVKSK